jgi:hypothetical protein
LFEDGMLVSVKKTPWDIMNCFEQHGFSRKTLWDNGDIKQFLKDAREYHVSIEAALEDVRQHW